ncbi:hypothetical protein GCM10027048_22260 [Hymenobacter coalescens]
MLYRLLLSGLLLALCLLGPVAVAQQRSAARATAPRAAKPAPARASTASFFATYTYTSFTIFDQSNGPEPIAAEGVGGTLTLRPDGTYEQHLRLGGATPTSFDRSGQFTFQGDQISFRYVRQGQERTDNGTFRFDPKKGTLLITIIGFPAGNRSVYTLQAAR